MFLLMLKAVRNGKITDEFLDATEAALHMDGDQVSLSNANALYLLFYIRGECIDQVVQVSQSYLGDGDAWLLFCVSAIDVTNLVDDLHIGCI